MGEKTRHTSCHGGNITVEVCLFFVSILEKVNNGAYKAF